MTEEDADSILYPNRGRSPTGRPGVSRRHLLAGSATAGAVATAGCLGGGDGGGDGPSEAPTVFVFNTGDGTVSLIDPEGDELVETRALGLSSSFPSNQYTPGLTDDAEDSLWLNVGRGVRGLSVGELSETAAVETGSGANWLEQTPDGRHVVVSAREPSHAQFRLDADPASENFGEVTAEIDRTPEGGRGDRDGPGPCDVTIHPDGAYAYVPDLFGDTLTVLSVEPFEVVAQIDVDAVGDGPARPWMATVAPDGRTLLVEHNEAGGGSESIWTLEDPAEPRETARLTGADGLGRRPLTSEIGPDSETGYVFTPGSNDVTVVDLADGTVTTRLDVGGSAFVGTWNPSRTKLYVPVQSTDEVAVVDHERTEVVARIGVGPRPYGATSASVRPQSDPSAALAVAMARLGIAGEQAETTYCIGNCACGHRL
jgi:DNA-binding beta-propeller fold protein YncE